MCECPKCLIADYPHPLDFLMWRVELGLPTVRIDDLAQFVKLRTSSLYGKDSTFM